MDEEFVADLWNLFKDYLDKKHTDTAAERFVDMLVDYGFQDDQLTDLLGNDKILDYAIQYYLEMDKDDFNEDNERDE
mgnify:CR=1 FL=1